MPNCYTEFATALRVDVHEALAWWHEQTNWVEAFGDIDKPEKMRVYPEGGREADAELDVEPDFTGPLFLLDYQDYNGDEECGFSWNFDGVGGKAGSIIIYSEESGTPERLAFLVQKYLKRYNPQGHWGMTWCSRTDAPRIGEFGGGAVLVTANEQYWMNAHNWLEQVKKLVQQTIERGETLAEIKLHATWR